VAGQRPKDVASVITLAAPHPRTVANRAVLHAAESVRLRILEEHGRGVLPDAIPDAATCNFWVHCGADSRVHDGDSDLHAARTASWTGGIA